MHRLILLLLLILVFGCSSQKKLQRTFVGKPLSAFEKAYGKPVALLDRSEGKVYVFAKTEVLKSTEIGQAKLTLDPMMTPTVTKTDKYYVTVKNDVVTKVKQETEYER
ncbi:hypothetical protein [Maribellus sediminis]|uniref:hypothetical protein n=1 Tax=Maribellus sediminis TaxID=2696285 RepID=UPI0014320A7A|nr:hypothetical protein [Maribellus sediminis]